MEEKKQVSGGSSVVKGTAIIGVAGIVVKILGAVFRIPLANWAGELAMSYYQVAYNIYNALVIMAIAGFPVAISKLVSENIALGRHENAHKIFKTAIKIMALIGGIAAGICFFGADRLSEMVGNPLAASSVRAIAPALIFVPLHASFRGFFQGRQNMNPTALSEIVEQFIRVIVGLTLAKIFISGDAVKAMAGASFGASAGSMAALALMIFIYVMHKKIINKEINRHERYTEDTATIIKKILVIAIPIVIGAEIIPIMYTIDMGIIMNRLQATGWAATESQRLYGLMSGYCNSLINLPEFLIHAIAISMVPAISHAAAKGLKEDVHSSINTGYRLTTFIAFPCMVGLFVMAKPILTLLYPMRVNEAMEAIPTFLTMTLSIVTLALYETSTGTLQAVGKQIIPVRNVAIGAGIKIVLTYILVGIHSINVVGAAISSVFAYLIPFVLNEMAVRKYTGVKVNIKNVYLKPGLASLVMGVGVFIVYKLLSMVFGNTISTGIAILIGVLIYILMVIVTKSITPEELMGIPGGAKLDKILKKFPGWN